MCGLAGAVALRGDARPDAERVRRMTAAIEHRGPDDHGFWTSPSGAACFGHRRLSIIDLVAGHQPVIGADGTVGLIFNGEIYNYLELRDELSSLGVRFATDSDTEVLLHALLERGDEALQSLIGMYAFAFWDDRSRRLILVRDRVGKKPLYHFEEDGCLYFCSTLTGLEHAMSDRPEIDETSVANFLNLGYVPAPDTIYRGVKKLPAATIISVSQDRPEPESRRYWDPAGTENSPVSPESALDELEAVLDDAVRLRLRSDVPLGVFLSGGVDSSLVAAVASRQSPNRVSTFTVGFNVAEFNEAERARRIAAYIGTDHHELTVDTDVVDLLPKLIEHFGEPFADSSALPVWRLAEAARRHITVALMGDGGDEGFAGYDWYRTAMRLDRLARTTGVARLGSLTQMAVAPLGAKARRLAYLLTAAPSERFANLRLMFGRHTTSPPLFTPSFEAGLDRERLAVRHLVRYYDEEAGPSPLHGMQYVDLRSYLPGDLLPKVDVCTMAHGLEARAPLLDHRILEFAFRLPASLHRADRPKGLLRQLLGRYLPSELTDGPKMGFSVPLPDWFRGDLRPLVSDLSDGSLAATGWVNPATIDDLVEDHLRSRRNNGLRLFHLLVLQMWLDGYSTRW